MGQREQLRKRRNEALHESKYEAYLHWVETNENSVLYRRWGILLAVSVTLIVVAILIYSGPGSMQGVIQALISVPAAFMLFVIGVGVTHKNRLAREGLSLKEKYSPGRRRKLAGWTVVGAALASVVLSSYLPYAVGGVLLLCVIFALLDLIRLTPEEEIREEAGVLDPRDYQDEDELARLAEEDSDILDEDFSWDAYEESEEYAEDEDESAEYDDSKPNDSHDEDLQEGK